MLFTDLNGGLDGFAKDPAVIHFGDKYFLYYSIYFKGENEDNGVLKIGIATSTDMDHWEIQGYLPLTQDCEAKGVGAPAAYVEGDTVHLFYQTYGNWENDALCHATSKDGLHFEKNPTNPIFRPTKDWCCGRAIDADVVAFNGKLFLYFATRDHKFEIQKLGVAYAPLGSDYTRDTWTQAVNDSILFPEEEWEGKCIEAAATFVRNNKVYLFYGGSYNCTPQQIGYAVSEDGVNFQKPTPNVPFIPCGKEGDWNASESGHPYAFVDNDGSIHLFYQGSPNKGKTWYLSRCELTFDGDTPRVLAFHNEL